MKAEILKIAGVKSEKEFYKKFPTKEDFMKAHKKEFQKAKRGKTIQDKGQAKKLNQLTSFEMDVDDTVPKYQFSGPGLGLSTGNVFNTTATMNPYLWGQTTNISGVAAQPAMINPGPAPIPMDVRQTGTFQQQVAGSIGALKPPSMFDKLGGAAGIAQSVGNIVGGISQIGAEKNKLKQLRQQAKVTGVQAMAAASRDVNPIKNRYVRPEDMPFAPEQLYPSYGTGTNILAAKKGGKIGGTPTEIQNTYVPPTDIYTDSGYVPKAAFGFANFASQGGGAMAGNLANALTGNTGEGRIGSTVGTAAGTLIGGPIGGMIGSALGGLVGGVFGSGRRQEMKKRQREIDANVASMTGQQIPQQFNAYMENGGQVSDYEWVSHTWTPQLITHFGEHKMSDLLKPDETMDTLRTGGSIRQNYMYPQDQFAMGGELQTTWGGYAEPIAQNPYLPGTGDIVMFRGNSHDEADRKGRTGIGVKYGNDGEYSPYMEYGKDGVENVTDVEVERNEPATELIDPQTGEKKLGVFGNIRITPELSQMANLPKDMKGKKFKHLAKDLAEKTNRQNKIKDKAFSKLDDLDVQTSFDKLKLASLQAAIQGADMKTKEYADSINSLASLQSSINDHADRYGVDPDDLLKGKFTPNKLNNTAKMGKTIHKAQDGVTEFIGYDAEGFPIVQADASEMDETSNQAKYFKDPTDIANYYKQFGYTGKADIGELQKWIKEKANQDPRVKQELTTYLRRQDVPLTNLGKRKYKGRSKSQLSDDQLIDQFVDKLWEFRFPKMQSLSTVSKTYPPRTKTTITTTGETTTAAPKQIAPVPPKKRNQLLDVLGQVMPYLRPSDAEPLDMRQIYGELSVMGDQPEAVQAQLYRPQLKSIYDISLQDQLNEVTAQARAAERMSQYNPAAAANIMSMANRERSKILGEQTRMNQALQAGIIGENINTLNDAQLKNLSILDQQYVRQEQAKANTKATKLAALQSIGNKYMQNQASNRALQTYENLYGYRFGPDFRAVNMNAPYFPVISEVSGGQATASTSPVKNFEGKDYLPIYNNEGEITGYKKKKESARNGSIVRALKNI